MALAVDSLLRGSGISTVFEVASAKSSTLMLRLDFNQDSASPVNFIAPPRPIVGLYREIILFLPMELSSFAKIKLFQI